MATKVYVTDGTKTETILATGMKGIDPWDESRPGVWSPDPPDLHKQAQSARLVPSVFAGVSARMQAMADLPFCIYSVKGDKELDNSDHYKNVIKIMPNPYKFLSLTEGALVLAGQSYWYKGKGQRSGSVKELKYWRPDSVKMDTHAAASGEIVFERTGSNKKFPAEEVLYSWGLDPMVELGAPGVYPFASAMTAATANGAISQWVADYMQRGAIKAMMLMVEGMPPPAEVERMESWFNRFMRGIRLQWKVFNAAGVKPTIIGDGLEALRDLSITADLRYEVHQALGTRHLLEDENYATAKARERQFYQMVIVPDARLIQTDLNEQILHPMGFHLEFEPERLESFQEDEAEQVQAFSALLEVLMRGLPFNAAFRIAAEKLDYQFSDEQMAEIDKAKREEPETLDGEPEETQEQTRALVELDKWKAKSDKAGKITAWHAKELSPDMVKAITEGAMTWEQARLQLTGRDAAIIALAKAIEGAL